MRAAQHGMTLASLTQLVVTLGVVALLLVLILSLHEARAAEAQPLPRSHAVSVAGAPDPCSDLAVLATEFAFARADGQDFAEYRGFLSARLKPAISAPAYTLVMATLDRVWLAAQSPGEAAVDTYTRCSDGRPSPVEAR